jgi:hypothetical protein
MLSPRLLFPLMALLCLTGCQRSTEAKLIGTWDVSVTGVTDRVTYKPDHTCFTSIAGFIALKGRWRVEGNQLIATYKNQEVKATIVKITGDELKVKFAGKDTVYTWMRVK